MWMKSWSKKEETRWKACLENLVAELMELGIVETYLTQHALVGDASNAEPQTSPFMKDGTSDWHILSLAWFGKV